MRKPTRIALGALAAAVVLFVVDLPFGNQGVEKTIGSVLFVLSVAAVAVFVVAGIWSLVTRSRARTQVG